jgi:hypothetical protein
VEHANITYINTYAAPDWPRIRRAVYSWGLIGFGLLDVVLLFWLLNPFSGPAAPHSRVFADQSQTAAAYDVDSVASKPSPLGSVVVHKAKKPVRVKASVDQASLR